MYKQLIFIIILFISMGFQVQREPDYTPMLFSMNNEWKAVSKDELIFEFESLDTVYDTEINHQMRLLSNSEGAPRLFFSEIETPVCADGVCQLAHINVYWNLLGNYVGYSISPKFPLTKFEHKQFEKEDYAKLHQLLLDDNSILKRRKMSDLIDEIPVSSSNHHINDFDAISGATKTEIKESVVKGGLYSCYTIWHIVHGEVKEKMKKYLQSIYSDTLTHYFLNTPYKDYQMYALKQLQKTEYKEHSNQIISIYKTTDALTKAYILKKIPEDVLSEEEITIQFYNEFRLIDINSRTLLIHRLKSANKNATDILSKYVDSMSKNQLKLYLKYLNNNPVCKSDICKSNLKKGSKNKRYIYSYLLKEFLLNRK